MTFSSRLFNRPKLVEIVSLTDDMADQCGEIADTLAEYENADELSGEEQTEARQDAREVAWTLIDELLSNAERLRQIRDTMNIDTPEGGTQNSE